MIDAFVLSRRHFAEFGQEKSAGYVLPQLVELLETSRAVRVRASSGSNTAGSHVIRAVTGRNSREAAKATMVGRMVFDRGLHEFDGENAFRIRMK